MMNWLLAIVFWYVFIDTSVWKPVLERVLEGSLCRSLKDYMIGSGLLIQLRRNSRDVFEVI